MAHRVQLHNNIRCFITLLCCCVLLSCNTQQKPAVVTGAKVASGDTSLSVVNGIIYFNNHLFTGQVYTLHKNGDTAAISQYTAGKENGWQRKWYPNNHVAEERFYEDGRKEGIHRGWWENGKARFEYHFQNDQHEGQLKEWYTDGRFARLFHYSKGYEEGRQQMWWPDGRIRANYIVKDGERFGLLGQKLCNNKSE